MADTEVQSPAESKHHALSEDGNIRTQEDLFGSQFRWELTEHWFTIEPHVTLSGTSLWFYVALQEKLPSPTYAFGAVHVGVQVAEGSLSFIDLTKSYIAGQWLASHGVGYDEAYSFDSILTDFANGIFENCEYLERTPETISVQFDE